MCSNVGLGAWIRRGDIEGHDLCLLGIDGAGVLEGPGLVAIMRLLKHSVVDVSLSMLFSAAIN